jgi:hypothetical protein
MISTEREHGAAGDGSKRARMVVAVGAVAVAVVVWLPLGIVWFAPEASAVPVPTATPQLTPLPTVLNVAEEPTEPWGVKVPLPTLMPTASPVTPSDRLVPVPTPTATP